MNAIEEDREDAAQERERARAEEEAAKGWQAILPQYRPSLRLDGLYEIYLYPDDPAFVLAEIYLKKRNFTALSAGKAFVGRPEDYAYFEAALKDTLSNKRPSGSDK